MYANCDNTLAQVNRQALHGGGMRFISYELPSVIIIIQCHFLCPVVVKAMLNPSSPFNLAKGKLITKLRTIEFRLNWWISDNLCKFIHKLSFPLCSSSNTDDSLLVRSFALYRAPSSTVSLYCVQKTIMLPHGICSTCLYVNMYRQFKDSSVYIFHQAHALYSWFSISFLIKSGRW